MGHVTPAFRQQSFRIRNNDGDEATATWIAAADTNVTISGQTLFRIRFLIQETAGGSVNNQDWRLQHNKNSTGWVDTTIGSSDPVRGQTSSEYEAGDTVQRLGSGTFITPNGGMTELDPTWPSTANWAGNDETEYECNLFFPNGQNVAGDTFQFRIALGDSTPIDSYISTPTVTYQTHQIDQNHFRGRNDDGDETTATWIDAVDTNFYQNQDAIFRVRFGLTETGSAASSTAPAIKLQSNTNGAGWQDVTNVSTNVIFENSVNVVNGSVTTQQITSGTFWSGSTSLSRIIENTSLVASANFPADNVAEPEWVLSITFDVSNGDTVQLRIVYTDDQQLGAYTLIPTITAGPPPAPPGDQNSLLAAML